MSTSRVFDLFEEISAFSNFELTPAPRSEYKLERMRAILADFGDPHEKLNVIHVAGSKGKGSSANFCARILHRLSPPVGIFLSPHVRDWRERIRGAEGFYADGVYEEILEEVLEYANTSPRFAQLGRPTTFELLTLAAFLVYTKMKCSWVVLETGLGGRLDCTNVVTSPRACLVTRLELEHTEVLGNTLAEIAFEKAGIFKRGAVLLSQLQREEAVGVLREKAEALGGDLKFVEPLITGPGYWRLPDSQAITWRPRALGSFQAANAALAATCIRELRTKNPDLAASWDIDAVEAAIRGAFEEPALEARQELLLHPGRPGSLILLDAAHTPDSVRASLETFVSLAREGTKTVLLFACAKDKKDDLMAEILAPHFPRIVITRPGSAKASDPQRVYDSFARFAKGSTELFFEPHEALSSVLDANVDLSVLIVGSFYLAGQILPLLESMGWNRPE